MLNNAQTFTQKGYIALKQALNSDDMETLERSSDELYERSEQLLKTIEKNGETLTDFYNKNTSELIVVPEIDNASKVCRYEYISGYSVAVRTKIIPKIQTLIEQLTQQKFVLFKDKCNAKNPGGGAFAPHQDVIAYDQFKPTYHITAAIFLDDATIENGCLFFPENYLEDLKDLNTTRVSTLNGNLPILDSDKGGRTHGNICQAISDQIRWTPVTAKKGDVVLFDSYAPHYSEKNNSNMTRRAMFFTFNAESDGDFYQAYYDMKHREFDNPKFHIATPTAHRELTE